MTPYVIAGPVSRCGGLRPDIPECSLTWHSGTDVTSHLEDCSTSLLARTMTLARCPIDIPVASITKASATDRSNVLSRVSRTWNLASKSRRPRGLHRPQVSL